MTASDIIVDRGYPPPDNDGWWQIPPQPPGQEFSGVLGPLRVRRESDRCARLRMLPEQRHANGLGAVHGGTIVTLIDVGLFAIPFVLSNGAMTDGVTLDLSNRFIGSGRLGIPLDVVGEIVGETGRMVFLRGLVEQSGTTIGSFEGTLRKIRSSA